MSFILYVTACAWQDGRKRAVSGWLFLFFFVHFAMSQVCQGMLAADMQQFPASFWYRGMLRSTSVWQCIGGSLIGLALLVVNRITEGGIGEGDGIFFLITGIYLGFWKTFFLLAASLFLCSIVGLGYVACGRLTGKGNKKKKLPFLVFTFPVGIFLALT